MLPGPLNKAVSNKPVANRSKHGNNSRIATNLIRYRTPEDTTKCISDRYQHNESVASLHYTGQKLMLQYR